MPLVLLSGPGKWGVDKMLSGNHRRILPESRGEYKDDPPPSSSVPGLFPRPRKACRIAAVI